VSFEFLHSCALKLLAEGPWGVILFFYTFCLDTKSNQKVKKKQCFHALYPVIEKTNKVTPGLLSPHAQSDRSKRREANLN